MIGLQRLRSMLCAGGNCTLGECRDGDCLVEHHGDSLEPSTLLIAACPGGNCTINCGATDTCTIGPCLGGNCVINCPTGASCHCLDSGCAVLAQ